MHVLRCFCCWNWRSVFHTIHHTTNKDRTNGCSRRSVYVLSVVLQPYQHLPIDTPPPVPPSIFCFSNAGGSSPHHTLISSSSSFFAGYIARCFGMLCCSFRARRALRFSFDGLPPAQRRRTIAYNLLWVWRDEAASDEEDEMKMIEQQRQRCSIRFCGCFSIACICTSE